jgi:hypothetical protein
VFSIECVLYRIYTIRQAAFFFITLAEGLVVPLGEPVCICAVCAIFGSTGLQTSFDARELAVVDGRNE